MQQKTTEEMIRELYTVVLGVPATGEKEMAKLVYDIDKHLRELNGSVKTNTTWRKAFCWILGILTTALVTTIVFVLSGGAMG